MARDGSLSDRVRSSAGLGGIGGVVLLANVEWMAASLLLFFTPLRFKFHASRSWLRGHAETTIKGVSKLFITLTLSLSLTLSLTHANPYRKQLTRNS